MTEKITPQAGDVWLGIDRVQRWVYMIAGQLFVLSQDGEWDSVEDIRLRGWLKDASLVFRDSKPVPAPQVETITIECAVLQKEGDPTTINISGHSKASPGKMHDLQGGQLRYRMIGIAPVKIDVSLLSVPVLDPVQVPQ